ncbi:MAG: CIA30 family protein [Planctomycetota bacterium]
MTPSLLAAVFLAAQAILPAQNEPAESRATRIPSTRVLCDFGNDAECARWRTVLDGVMGGRSTGSFRKVGDRIMFGGVLNTNGGGFSSIRRPVPDLQLGQPGELGIRLRVRGDGRTYTLRLRQPVEQRRGRFGASYRTTFQTTPPPRLAPSVTAPFEDVYIPYADLKPTWRGRSLDLPPVTPSLVDEIGVSIDDKIDGAFQIELTQIATYAEFRFDSFASDKRVVVVVATDERDAKLRETLADIDTNKAGFGERDIALCVLLSQGTSRAGNRELTVAEVATVRSRLETDKNIDPSPFEILLVGKDGGTKFRGQQAVAAQRFFDMVDEMPMRKRELREARRRN